MSNKNKEKTGEKQETTAPVTGSAGKETQQGGAETSATVTGANGSQEPGSTGAAEHPNPARAESDAAEGKAAGNTGKTAETKETEEPKVSNAVVKIGKSLLKSNPAMSVVYMTSDGRGFYEKNDADNYARTLKNKAVTPVKK